MEFSPLESNDGNGHQAQGGREPRQSRGRNDEGANEEDELKDDNVDGNVIVISDDDSDDDEPVPVHIEVTVPPDGHRMIVGKQFRVTIAITGTIHPPTVGKAPRTEKPKAKKAMLRDPTLPQDLDRLYSPAVGSAPKKARGEPKAGADLLRIWQNKGALLLESEKKRPGRPRKIKEAGTDSAPKTIKEPVTRRIQSSRA